MNSLFVLDNWKIHKKRWYVIFIFIILLFLLVYFFMYKTINIKIINRKNINKYNNDFKLLEKRITNWYPLGDNDFFKIDHGPNYFSFFNRLGSIKVATLFDKNNLIGNLIGVLRKIPLDNKYFKTWYLCDLKIDKKYRGDRLSFHIFTKIFKYLSICNSFYGISMDSQNGNHMVKIVSKIPFITIKSKKLLIYKLSYNDMIRVYPIIEKHRGPLSFLSLYKKKDLILKSNNKPMKLLHTQWSPTGEYTGLYKPIKNFEHMFCSPSNDPMSKELERIGITTNVTATIIYYNMNNINWNFILTSDI